MLPAFGVETLLPSKVVSDCIQCFEMGRLPFSRSKLFAFSFFCKPQYATHRKKKEGMNNIFIPQTKSCEKRKVPRQRRARLLGTRFQERKLRGREACFLKLKITVLFLIKLRFFQVLLALPSISGTVEGEKSLG